MRAQLDDVPEDWLFLVNDVPISRKQEVWMDGHS